MGDPGPTWFRKPYESTNGIPIGSFGITELTLETDTDRLRYNGNNSPHLMLRVAMRPRNKTRC